MLEERFFSQIVLRGNFLWDLMLKTDSGGMRIAVKLRYLAKQLAAFKQLQRKSLFYFTEFFQGNF